MVQLTNSENEINYDFMVTIKTVVYTQEIFSIQLQNC